MTSIDRTETSGRTRPYSWYVLALLLAVYACSWMDRFVVVIVLEHLKAEFGLSDALLGALSGFTFSLIYSLAGIPIARLADRGVRRTILSVAVTLWSASTALFGMAASAAQLLVTRLGVALGEATTSPTAHSLISDYFPPHRRGIAFSIYGLGTSIGIALGLAIGGWFAEHHGWRSAFLAASIPGFVLAVLLRFTVKEPQRGQCDAGDLDARTFPLRNAISLLFSRKSFLAYGVGLALITFTDFAFSTWSPAYLMRVRNMGTADVGTWMGTLSAVAGCIGTIAGGFAADILGRRDVRWYLWVPGGAAMFMVLSMYLFLHLPGNQIFVFYFTATLCGATCMGPMIAITHRIVPLRLRAFSSAVLLLLLNLLGVGPGPLVTGIISDLSVAHGAAAVQHSLTMVLAAALIGGVLVLHAARGLKEDLNTVAGSENAPAVAAFPAS